jgi:hypothetical protein
LTPILLVLRRVDLVEQVFHEHPVRRSESLLRRDRVRACVASSSGVSTVDRSRPRISFVCAPILPPSSPGTRIRTSRFDRRTVELVESARRRSASVASNRAIIR